MTPSEYKIRQEHLSRMACIYVRQSTTVQVQEHQESTRRQYALVQHAKLLGWPDERILVIDEDLGHSASDMSQPRSGFQKLLTKVVTGEAGAIFSVEVSRLALQSSILCAGDFNTISSQPIQPLFRTPIYHLIFLTLWS